MRNKFSFFGLKYRSIIGCYQIQSEGAFVKAISDPKMSSKNSHRCFGVDLDASMFFA